MCYGYLILDFTHLQTYLYLMQTLLLAATIALSGPPEPQVDLMHHFEAKDRPKASQTLLKVSLQAAAAGFDLWTTQRCLNKGTCYETNPLGSPDKVPYTLKGVTFLVPAALTIWADKTGKERLAWWITALSVAIQVGFGVNNLIVGN